MYTTTSVFLATLARAGITHAFANWGSDHPAMLEELERQRRASATGDTLLKIVTCPNEMVALSAAQGYAQVTGRPAAVIVHVDVGTQSLGGAVHNVDRGRVPVLIYAGASAFTSDGELKGSRNEWIMWLQDIPDQPAIVRQYMRWTHEIYSGKNVAQVVMRGLQIATSEPKGPVYLWGRREAMEEEITEEVMTAQLNSSKWTPVAPAGLAPDVAHTIAAALLAANAPLIITSRMPCSPGAGAFTKLQALAAALSIAVLASCPSAVCFPFSQPYFQGTTFGKLTPAQHATLAAADVVLVLDCDIPWIAGAGTQPRRDARVFVLDAADPLKRGMGFAHVDAELVCAADADVAIAQILDVVVAQQQKSELAEEGQRMLDARRAVLQGRHDEWMRELEAAEAADGALLTVPHLIAALRRALEKHGERVLVLNEAISSYPLVWTHMRPERAGAIISSGGSSLGWALGAAVGAHLAATGVEIIVAVVGDGSFLFGAPSSAYWMARKYETPFLTIILNNGGWKSPKLSMLGVYPQGLGSEARGERLTVGFGPQAPDYAQIASAAGGAWGKRVLKTDEMEDALTEAIKVVLEEKRCAVLDCVLEEI